MLSKLARLLDPGAASVEDVLARSAEFEAQIKPRDALRVTTEAARKSDDPRLAAAAMRLRHLMFDRGPGRPDWPPAHPDAFPNVANAVPEIRASELTTATMAGAILHHGALIVRGLIEPAKAAELRGDVDKAIVDCRRVRAGETEVEGSPWYARAPLSIDHEVNKSRAFTELEGSAVLAGDSPRTFQTVIDLYEKLGVFRAVEGYLGERPALSLAKTVLRKVPITNGTDWHQDGAFLGESIRVVNLWLALSDCGVDAPGLDMVPKRIPKVVPTGINSWFHWSVGEGTVAEAAGGTPIQTPVFKAGDAMMFDHLFLHRTSVRPGMTKERYAIEAWMFAPSTFPEENYPLVV
jgi:hypothetical protein